MRSGACDNRVRVRHRVFGIALLFAEDRSSGRLVIEEATQDTNQGSDCFRELCAEPESGRAQESAPEIHEAARLVVKV